MKRLVLFIFSFLTIFVSQVYAVVPTQYINDEANILTVEQKQTLNNLVNNFESKTGNEIAVLVIPELKNETIESQAIKTFEEWGIGKKGKDNGVLLLISIKDRQMRIEVGYGLEGVLTDLKSNQIIRDIITPEFKKNNYYLGIKNGLDTIIGIISGDIVLPPEIPNSNLSEELVGLIIFIGYILFVIIAKTKSWWLGGVVGAAIGIWYGNLISVGIFTVIGLIIDFILSLLGQNTAFMNVVHTIGRFSTGGRSGGGGGFGGGRSGGGGSSGRW